ncbi:hypothetical protein FSB78_02680 [Sphingomonas ginsenosidivorax]|uniref:Uncharacterized protein n=1 Tax=Sphingomonas ginsenosidivorax TaxID=862135 RepID=A0A5C6UDE3_9SPHN|nr:hypothetical protein [Sphingomonas ginsenosidivorax]TXC69978.1 hypothetical protein FSB78_02680 [Sphingomonas ginsenosidivorax]
MRSLPVYGGLGVGVIAAIAFVAMPADTLESLVWNSGVAAVLPVAAPPLGVTARALLALGSGVLFAAVTWAALYLLFGPGGFLVKPVRSEGVPVIRRADAHPDAPPRRPMSSADLGMPLMEVVMPAGPERPIPADLDLPLAAFDPAALLQVPMEPARPVAPLVTPLVGPMPAPIVQPEPVPEPTPALRRDPQPAAEPERIEAVEPTPATRPVRPAPTGQPSIESLLRRLEQGAGRRSPAAAR